MITGYQFLKSFSNKTKIFSISNITKFKMVNIKSYKRVSREYLNIQDKSKFSFSSINPQQYQKLKQQGQQFYSQQVEKIIQLQKSQDWQPIMSKIMHDPVIVDFYADWCQPCKILTPKLQERVKKLNNVTLLKINIDKCQDLAHTMQIKSVPTVYLVFQNQAIDRFQGAIDDATLDKFFQTTSKLRQLFNQYTVQVKKLDEAKKLLSDEKYQESQDILKSINSNEKDVLAIKQIFLAQIYLSKNEIGKFKSQIQVIKTYQEMYSHNQDLKKFYEIMIAQQQQITDHVQENIEIVSLKQQIQKDPQNLQLLFSLATAFKKYQMLQDSLQQALKIIKKDKNWSQKKAQKFVLQIFKQLGNSSPITLKYRKLYQRMLN